MKAVTFNRVLNKCTSEAGYPSTFQDVSSHPRRKRLSFPLLRAACDPPLTMQRKVIRVPLQFPSSEAVISFITETQPDLCGICSPDICPSPVSHLPFAHSSSPAPPALPQRSPFALRLVGFEPLCALRLESELCINLFGLFICTRSTLQLRQAWGVQDPLVRLPWGDT